MIDRLKSAFVNPSALTDEDVAAMITAMRKDANASNARRNRLQNAGAGDGNELARKEAYQRRRAKKFA